MDNRFFYKEEIYFAEHHKQNLLEHNQEKVVDMLLQNTAVGVVGGFYEEGLPIHFISQFALRNIGYTFEEFMEKTGGNFIEAVCPDDRRFYTMDLLGQSDGSEKREFRLINQKGDYVWVSEMRTKSVADNGRPLWISSIRLVHNEHMAKRHFISKISHDLRTPMNAILGMARLARYNIDNREKLDTYLDLVIQSSYHLLNEIGQVLDLKSIESGVMQLEEQPFNLHELVQEIEELFAGRLENKKQRLVISYKHVRHNQLIGDTVNLQKVIMNLLANAIKYSPDESDIELDVEELEPADPDKAGFEFRVTDHGIGIPESMQDRIFEPFERIEDSRESSDIPHIGLGLAVTKSIVQMMGGTLRLTSEVDVGSTFTIAQQIRIQTEESRQQSEKSAPSLEDMRVLAVEDNQINQELIVEMLNQDGIDVDVADNGAEAVKLFASHENGYYHIILMDINMPVMNGYECADTIRQMPEHGGDMIPIIAVTSDTLAEDVKLALSHGMNGHMPKPINFEELRATLLFWKNKHKI